MQALRQARDGENRSRATCLRFNAETSAGDLVPPWVLVARCILFFIHLARLWCAPSTCRLSVLYLAWVLGILMYRHRMSPMYACWPKVRLAGIRHNSLGATCACALHPSSEPLGPALVATPGGRRGKRVNRSRRCARQNPPKVARFSDTGRALTLRSRPTGVSLTRKASERGCRYTGDALARVH